MTAPDSNYDCDDAAETQKPCAPLVEGPVTAELILALLRRPELAPKERRLLGKAWSEIVTPERIVCLCDKVAEQPEWWKANRLYFYMYEWSFTRIAQFIRTSRAVVEYAVRHVTIPDDVYADLPPLPKIKTSER